MSVLGGHATPSRRICVHGEGVAAVALALAETQGHRIVSPDEHASGCDLAIVEAAHPEDLPTRSEVPLLALVTRRLRATEVRAFEAAGATRVVDAYASILDVAFAFSDLLFDSLCAQRRYARVQGGAQVRFWSQSDGPANACRGRLVGIARAGTYLITDDVEPEGTPIEMAIELAGHPVHLIGRVTCQVGHDDRRGFGVEFALDHSEVAPRLCELSTRMALSIESVSMPLRAAGHGSDVVR